MINGRTTPTDPRETTERLKARGYERAEKGENASGSRVEIWVRRPKMTGQWTEEPPGTEGWYFAREKCPRTILVNKMLPGPGPIEIMNVTYCDTGELAAWGIMKSGAPLNNYIWYSHPIELPAG